MDLQVEQKTDHISRRG